MLPLKSSRNSAARFRVVILAVRMVAAQLQVPISPMPVAQGTYAQFQSFYPNPQINSNMCKYVDIGKANAVAIHNINLPNSTKYLFMEYPYSPEPLIRDWSIGVFQDIANTANWSPLHTSESLFCAGHSITSDGTIFIAGGYNQKIVGPSYGKITYQPGLQGARVFDPKTSSTNYVGTMADPRWYPLVINLPDQTMAIIGGLKGIGNRAGGCSTINIWDPKQPINSTMKVFNMDSRWFNGMLQKPSYPFAWVLPTGHVFLYGDAVSCIWNPKTGQCLTMPDPTDPTKTVLVSPPPRPNGHNSNYPWTAGAVMTPLQPHSCNKVYSAEFVIFGGSRKDDHPGFKASNYTDWHDYVWDVEALASRYSHRIQVSWSRASNADPWTFSFGSWVEEDMGYPRVMPDTVLLPNDDVVVVNGAQAGVAGWPRTNADGSIEPMSNLPAFWSSLYQINKGVNKRYTLLCGSQNPRMYHSSATLTVDGNILVAGGDRPGSFMNSNVSWFPTPTSPGTGLPPVYTMELFMPPYMFDTANKPQIDSVNGADSITIGYNTKFTINYSAAPVTSVVLVAPSSTTHSFNTNQRVVKLLASQVSQGVLQATTPYDPFHAPPGYYMLFINNGKTYSSAKWVKLVDTKGTGKAVPMP